MIDDQKAGRIDRLRVLQSELDALVKRENQFGYELPAEHQRIEAEMARVRAMGDTKAEPKML